MDTEGNQTDALDAISPFVGGDDTHFELSSPESRGDFITPESPADEPAPDADPEPVEEAAETEAAESSEAADEETSSEEDSPPEPEEDPAPADEEAPPSDEPSTPAVSTESQMVPKRRLDAKNRQIKELRDKLAGLEAREPAPAAPAPEASQPASSLPEEIGQLEKQYADLLLDGKVDAATELRSTINQKMFTLATEQATAAAEQKAATAYSEGQSQSAFDETVSSLQDKFPVLDNSDEGFNATTTEAIVALSKSLQTTEGFTAADSLLEATERLMPALHPEYFAPPAAAPSPAREEVTTTRTRQAVKKSTEAAARQPDVPAGAPARTAQTETLSVFTMSEEQFAQLTEDQLAKLRGDFV